MHFDYDVICASSGCDMIDVLVLVDVDVEMLVDVYMLVDVDVSPIIEVLFEVLVLV